MKGDGAGVRQGQNSACWQHLYGWLAAPGAAACTGQHSTYHPLTPPPSSHPVPHTLASTRNRVGLACFPPTAPYSTCCIGSPRLLMSTLYQKGVKREGQHMEGIIASGLTPASACLLWSCRGSSRAQQAAQQGEQHH